MPKPRDITSRTSTNGGKYYHYSDSVRCGLVWLQPVTIYVDCCSPSAVVLFTPCSSFKWQAFLVLNILGLRAQNLMAGTDRNRTKGEPCAAEDRSIFRRANIDAIPAQG